MPQSRRLLKVDPELTCNQILLNILNIALINGQDEAYRFALGKAEEQFYGDILINITF